MKCVARVLSLMFLPKTLIWNEIMFLASNSLHFVELVENEVMKCFVVWLTKERRLALFPAGNNVRDPQNRESPTRLEQDLSLGRA